MVDLIERMQMLLYDDGKVNRVKVEEVVACNDLLDDGIDHGIDHNNQHDWEEPYALELHDLVKVDKQVQGQNKEQNVQHDNNEMVEQLQQSVEHKEHLLQHLVYSLVMLLEWLP